MNLLGAKLYDPAGAVSKATSSLLAITAFDTTNLRLTVTVPSHGFLFCRMRCQLEGATTFPQVLLGLLNGASVAARVTPVATIGATALATTRVSLTAEFVIPGLTPGSITLDAAYGVEILLASTNIKYGGPNNTTTDDAWGAFVFELWDPQPLSTTNPISANVTQWNSTSVATPNTAGVPIVDQRSNFMRTNTAQATGNSTTAIKLDASASASTDFYKYHRITVISGTGAPQSALCTGYDGSTKIATVAPAWPTAPDNTSVFVVSMDSQSDVETALGFAQALTSHGYLKADATTINDTFPGAMGISNFAKAIPIGTCTTGGSTTSAVTSAFKTDGNTAATGIVANQYVGQVIRFSGDTATNALKNAASVITASSASNTPTFTLSPALPGTPTTSDTFIIMPGQAALANDISKPTGVCTNSSSTTSLALSALTVNGAAASGVVADQFRRYRVTFRPDTVTAGLRGQTAIVQTHGASNTPTLTITPFLASTPTTGDVFTLEPSQADVYTWAGYKIDALALNSTTVALSSNVEMWGGNGYGFVVASTGPAGVRLPSVNSVAVYNSVAAGYGAAYFFRSVAVLAAVDTGSTTTSVTTQAGTLLLGTVAATLVTDQLKGCMIVFDALTGTAALQGACAIITGNTSGNAPTFTVTPALPGTPASGVDSAVIIPVARPSSFTKATQASPRGTVGASPSTTSLTTSALTFEGVAASGVVASQFVGRNVIFDSNTTTAGLRGAVSAISASSASNTPTLTVATLPATPVAGDTFTIG